MIKTIFTGFVLSMAAMTAFADPAGDAIARAQLQRQQQADDISLRLQQSQMRLQTPSGDVSRAIALDRQQQSERSRLDAFNARQRALFDAQAPTAGGGVPNPFTDPARLARERQLELLNMQVERAVQPPPR